MGDPLDEHTHLWRLDTHKNVVFENAHWSPAMPTGLNTSHGYQPDAMVAFKYAGIWLGFANVFNAYYDTVDPITPGTANMVLTWSADARHWKHVAPAESFIHRIP